MSSDASFFATGGGHSHLYQSVRHSYPLAVRDAGPATAASLVARILPYSLAPPGLLLAFAIGTILWAGITLGGAAWLEARVAGPIAAVWLVAGLAAVGFAWFTVLRYVLHLVACGHVAVLTDLIVHGRVRDGNEGMVAYGVKPVRARFAAPKGLFRL